MVDKYRARLVVLSRAALLLMLGALTACIGNGTSSATAEPPHAKDGVSISGDARFGASYESD